MVNQDNTLFTQIEKTHTELMNRYSHILTVNPDLDRKLVSFQGNKNESEHKWYKYKEGFSAALVRYILQQTGIKSGRILDPFAGAGTTLFTASDLGMDAVGIELLPSSAEIIKVRQLLRLSDRQAIAQEIRKFSKSRIWEHTGNKNKLNSIRITAGAFPQENEHLLERYLYEIEQLTDKRVSQVLRFGLLCILESISYTRKDGQYLRWDQRSGKRGEKSNFDKGEILPFTQAIREKLEEIATDLDGDNSFLSQLFVSNIQGKIELISGSCLEILPDLQPSSFDGLITSPPYCNRYDYTRTYALELALLGVDEETIKELRQTMLSCTVENRDKTNLKDKFSSEVYNKAIQSWSSQETLNTIINYLEFCRQEGSINNKGIPRMVSNYFKEMALVIFESARILKPDAPFIMVNDNVRYQGVNVPVDLILSDFAVDAGFDIEKIWVLPRGKGNSSQQMGTHGREEVRKCIYLWRKSKEQLAKKPVPQLALSL